MCSQCKEFKALLNDADVLEKHIASNNCGEKKKAGSKVTFNQQLASLRDRIDNFADPWEPADPVQIRAQIQKWHNEAQHKGHTTLFRGSDCFRRQTPSVGQSRRTRRHGVPSFILTCGR